jgi:hypothetical protein
LILQECSNNILRQQRNLWSRLGMQRKCNRKAAHLPV